MNEIESGSSARAPSATLLWRVIAPAGLLLLASAMLFAHAMHRPMNHDEHQFTVSAALLARRGLLPYRDYPYFHTPYLIYIYAAAFAFSDHLLLTARLISVACSAGIVAAIFFTSLRLFTDRRAAVRFFFAASCVALLMMHPIFMYTTGRSWNHDLPTLLMLLAMLALFRAGRARSPVTMHAIAGAMMGIAIGVRLTFAPIALAMAVFPLLAVGLSSRRKLLLAGIYSAGVIVALIPALTFLAISPREFLFGSFKYPWLNTEYRRLTQFHESMNAPQKVRYIVQKVILSPLDVETTGRPDPGPAHKRAYLLRGSTALGAICVAAIFLAVRRRRDWTPEVRRTICGMTIVIVGSLAGAIAPTPLYPSYFFTPLVLIVLLMAMLAAQAPRRCAWLAVMMIAATIATVGGAKRYSPRGLTRIQEWEPMRVHDIGVRIARSVPPGTTILSVAPLYAAEGKLDVFEQFTTGPFAFRVAMAVPAHRDPQLAPLRDVRTIFQSHTPHAVVTGDEGTLDREILEQLQDSSLQRNDVSSNCQVWIEADRR